MKHKHQQQHFITCDRNMAGKGRGRVSEKIKLNLQCLQFVFLFCTPSMMEIKLSFSVFAWLYINCICKGKKWLCGNRITNNIVIWHRKDSFFSSNNGFFCFFHYQETFYEQKNIKFLEKLLRNLEMKILVGSFIIIY